MMKPAWITEMGVWQDLCAAIVPKGEIDSQIYHCEPLEGFKT